MTKSLVTPTKGAQHTPNIEATGNHTNDVLSSWLPPIAELTLLQIVLNDAHAARAVCLQVRPLYRNEFQDPFLATIFGAVSTVVAADKVPTPANVAKELDSQARSPLTTEPKIYSAALAALREIADKVPACVNNPRRSQDFAQREACKLAKQIQKAHDATLPPLADIATDDEPDKPKKPPRFKVLSLAEVLTRPRLEYLIQDLLLERGTSAISADYGAYKSFSVLDMGLCIATGKDYHGRAVKRGAVVYIIAEGAYTTADRVRAWLIRYGLPLPENFYVIETPAQIADAVQRAMLIEEIRQYAPTLAMFDTLAKCNVGRDENATEAMGGFTYGMEEISRELNCHCLAVHHNNKSGTTRGSNALPSNVDTHITLKRSAGNVVTFECDKQKGAPFEPFSLVARVVELPEVDEYGRPVTSLIFEPSDVPPLKMAKADEKRQQVLDVLKQATGGLSATDWQKQVKDAVGIGSSRFYDYRDELAPSDGSGPVIKIGQLYKVKDPITPITPITPIHSDSTKSE